MFVFYLIKSENNWLVDSLNIMNMVNNKSFGLYQNFIKILFYKKFHGNFRFDNIFHVFIYLL